VTVFSQVRVAPSGPVTVVVVLRPSSVRVVSLARERVWPCGPTQSTVLLRVPASASRITSASRVATWPSLPVKVELRV